MKAVSDSYFRRRVARLLCASIALQALGMAGLASAQESKPDVPIDKAKRTQVIQGVAKFAEANYVFPALGKEIAQAIRERDRKGGYNDVSGAEALAARLTADMQSVTPDRHLKVLFSKEPRPMRDEAAKPSAEEREQQRQRAIRQNFGIERAEQLDGNVGYLKLTGFADPAFGGETMAAAMSFLANTDALLIDVRYNGGGHGEMVTLLTSYFFDETVHLADLYDRPTGVTSQSWTSPWVPGRRYTHKPIFIVTGERTFSAAEGFTYYLQKSSTAVVVGQPTGGGAHFVNIFQIDNHFATMIPIGNVTCPLTGSNWEGGGIVPDVPASNETAVRTAHRLALEKLLETAEGDRAGYLAMLVGEMKSETAKP